MPIRKLGAATFAFSAILFGLVAPPAAKPQAADSPPVLKLNLRSRVQPFKGSDAFEEVTIPKEFVAKETAILLCDMWNDHWCKSAAKRCDVLAKKMVPVVAAARAKGVTIIHSPSDCMEFYKDAPQRKRIQAVPKVEAPVALKLPDPPCPADSSDGGCDDDPPAKFSKAWTRQHASIPIEDNDVISDNGLEVYSFCKQQGIKNIIYMGVHTNMCVLHRTFAIKQMTKWGVRCVLVRDLTDSMYNPKMPPKVSHDEGTNLIVQFIEKNWCPTILSADLVK